MTWRWRSPIWLLAFSLLAIETTTSGHAQSCGPCAPYRARDPQSVTYRFAPEVAQHVRDAFEAAARDYENRYGSLFRFTHDQANGQMFISVSGNIPCGSEAWAAWKPNESITLCPVVNSDGNPNFTRSTAFHEVGHQAGLGGTNDPSCVGQTVMGPGDPTFTGHATSLTETDNCTITNEFVQPAACTGRAECEEAGYWWDPDFCYCRISPVLLTLGPNAFRLTSVDAGVDFDLNGDGTLERVSWTEADSDDAFVWMDRDGNGVVDGGHELFGDVTPLSWTTSGPKAAHGFDALGWFDLARNGGFSDGWIDNQDAVFGELRLWRDSNHDGVSQADEILTLAEARVERISLQIVESRRRDRHGNLFRYRAHVESLNDQGAPVRRLAYDVYLGKRP